MHFESHIRAFQVQWLRRYIDPGTPPWKLVADVWLADPYPTGRGMLLAHLDSRPSQHTDIPMEAKYFKGCVKQFELLAYYASSKTLIY